MTKKHFKLLADILKSSRVDVAMSDEDYSRLCAHVAREIAWAGVNPQFDRSKFLEACVVKA